MDGAVVAPGGGGGGGGAGAAEPGRAGTDAGPDDAARGAGADAAAGGGVWSRALERWSGPLSWVCGLVLVAATVEIVLDASLEHSPLIPHQPHVAAWLRSLGGERLGYRVFLIALLSSCVSYVLLLVFARARARARMAQLRMARLGSVAEDEHFTAGEPATAAPMPSPDRADADRPAAPRVTFARAAIALVVVLNLIVFAGLVLISTDVFSYLAYARMAVVHGIDPYLHGPKSIVGDPVYRYVGHDWLKVATAYGPVYTLITYPLGLLGVVGGLWGMKLYALIAAAITLLLTWRVAQRRGHDRVFALLAVGANPLFTIYALGGAHNDLIMLALMMAAVAFTLADRDGLAGATVVAGALVKATVGVLLPFMLLARRRSSTVYGALLGLAVCALAGYLAFGVQGLNVVAALNRDSAFVSTDSFPNELAHLAGKPGVFPVDHDLLKAALVVIFLHLLWRVWHGYDWVAASGWALLAISVTSTWLLAWYVLWPLPLAVVTRDRRLLVATLLVQGLFVVHQTAPLWVPVQ